MTTVRLLALAALSLLLGSLALAQVPGYQPVSNLEREQLQKGLSAVSMSERPFDQRPVYFTDSTIETKQTNKRWVKFIAPGSKRDLGGAWTLMESKAVEVELFWVVKQQQVMETVTRPQNIQVPVLMYSQPKKIEVTKTETYARETK